MTSRVNIIDIRGNEGDLPVTIHGEIRRQPLEAFRYEFVVCVFKFRGPQNRGRVRAGYLAHRAAIDNRVQVWVYEVENEAVRTGIPVPFGIWNSF